MEPPIEQVIRIREVPDPINVNANVQIDNPVQVSLDFNEQIDVQLLTNPRQPLHVAMDSSFRADRPVPVCISLCEPICAESDYTVGLTLLGVPIISIRVRGITRLFNCNDNIPR